MKEISKIAAILALTALSSFAQDKPEAKPEEKPAPAAEPAKPAAEPAKPAAKPEAGADKPKPTPEDRFKRMDKDGNGSLSLEEFRGKKSAEEAKEAFEKLDTNGDGSVSMEEFLAAPKKKKNN